MEEEEGGAPSRRVVRNSAPFPRRSLRYFLRAKATHPAKYRMATQQRADFNSATAQCYLHDVFPPCCVFPILPLGLLFFFATRSALNSPFPPPPASWSYILVDNRTPEPMPFPRLRTPSRVSFRALPYHPPPPFPRANLPLTYVRVFR